jgi:DNA-binding NarL/FixJ family response regulator
MRRDASPHRKLRVLIAEDNDAMRHEIERFLASSCEIVASVSNGLELLEVEPSSSAEIGIIDFSMPVMSGIEGARILQARGSKLVLIVLTTFEDSSYVEAAFDSGVSGFVVKRLMARDLPVALIETSEGRRFVSECRN